MEPSWDLKRLRGDSVVREEREGFLRGVVRMGVIARDLKILELRRVDLEGEVVVPIAAAAAGGTAG